MSHRLHLHSIKPFSALRECLKEGYTLATLYQDLMAGITVGIIAIPLSMALAIASGVPPQYGLYTAIIAGILIPLTGGSRYSISGPTAAFVVILYPVAQQFGLSGLLIASLMAGVMMVMMALSRLGRLIEYIPEPVTLGFTSGIAVVIATLQMKDFLGLELQEMPEKYIDKVLALFNALPTLEPAEFIVGATTLAVLIVWPRLRLPIPGHLPAVAIGVALSLLLANAGFDLQTIGSRFNYQLADGTIGQGIPPVLPEFNWPWLQPGPDGQPIDWDFHKLTALIPIAFSIAMLGAIESLLCAVVLDGMSGKRHHSNVELLGQGVGNLVTPWFGGITATAAIARSAANYRAGAQSPLAAVIHGLIVLVSLLILAPWLAYIPMASMAAMLLMVAWNMSEAPKVMELLKKAPSGDILVLLTCFSLTVMIDMVVAISFGIVLASLLFMRDIAQMTRVIEISDNRKHVPDTLPDDWGVYKISGPLFFAAADRIFSEMLLLTEHKQRVILYMDAVPILDAGGLSALNHFLEAKFRTGSFVIIADLQFQPLKNIAKAGLKPIDQTLVFTPTLAEAIEVAGAKVTQANALPQ
ncbi:sulfate permease, SulP family [Amphritea atlantica]|uniref:Sulfate permease, SulP family n=1 Tax=Amphritea atlantica TaxID=355243 RepID=A0A1H9JIX6_9GAMM|nr:C4-dicarboxylic acid transporter DauA [Amphritea atlantica]SEQ86737.1 sulfate permease, SulP family [Amphritea atlantica]